MQIRGILGVTLLVVLVAAGAAAGAAGKKVTLTVVVNGDGTVTSAPGRVTCARTCVLQVQRGSKVRLTADANDGSKFETWSAPCAASVSCTVKMTSRRTVHANFAPIPSPPAPKAGLYTGTYSDGTLFSFDVSGSSITHVNFGFNGVCSNGGTMSHGSAALNGPVKIGAHGAFSGTAPLMYPNSTGSFAIAGTVTTAGTASGRLHVTVDFKGGSECTSTGTWIAKLTA